MNVPQAIWIDEQGRIVRPPETAGSTDHFRRMDLKTKTMSAEDQAERGRFALPGRGALAATAYLLKHLLLRKAAAGVNIYVLFDSVGSHALPSAYLQALRDGVEVIRAVLGQPFDERRDVLAQGYFLIDKHDSELPPA